MTQILKKVPVPTWRKSLQKNARISPIFINYNNDIVEYGIVLSVYTLQIQSGKFKTERYEVEFLDIAMVAMTGTPWHMHSCCSNNRDSQENLEAPIFEGSPVSSPSWWISGLRMCRLRGCWLRAHSYTYTVGAQHPNPLQAVFNTKNVLTVLCAKFEKIYAFGAQFCIAPPSPPIKTFYTRNLQAILEVRAA